MSGLLSINISEARGFVAVDADVDRLAVVMGCASGLPAAAAGLRVETATVASPVTLTVADLLAAGVAALNANPRHIVITTGGNIPSDAPASVTISGLIWAPSGVYTAGSEVVNLAQTAGSVPSVNRYKADTLTLAFPAADGTDATLTIGYDEGQGLSPFFLSGSSAVAGVGYGDAPDTLTQIIEQRLNGTQGTKFPAALFTVPGDTAGSYGAIDITNVMGTALPATGSTSPFGTYYAAVQIIDDGNDGDGTTLGVTGILYQTALDYDGGRTWSNTTALGTGLQIELTNSGVTFTLDPPAAEVTALIALAVEAQTDTLAHLANVVAHDAADTSPEQQALAAAAAPTTAQEAWEVLNLCRRALDVHEPNITAHKGPDPVNVVTAAEADSAATGVALGADYKTKFNLHLGIALAADAVGLRAATATVAAPVTLTSVDLLAPGLAAIALYPRRLTFTTGGGTPADAPANVVITSEDGYGNVTTEVLALSQIAGAVTSVFAYDGTDITLAFPTADGTDATIAIGYAEGVHNSVDAGNVLTSSTPTQGTLKTGDVWFVRTLAPVPSSTSIADAFTALAASNAEHALLVLEFPLTQALVATVTTGLNALAAIGRDVTCRARTRLPDFEANETEAAWLAAQQTAFQNADDSRISLEATYGLITDAVTSRQYRRSLLAQNAADLVRVQRSQWAGSPSDPQAGAGIPNVILIDSTGATVGHDEGPQGAATGLSNSVLGNRFACVQRLAIASDRQAVYTTVPWVLYAGDEAIRTAMLRRLINAMKRVTRVASKPLLGSAKFYSSTGATTGTLTPSSRKSIHGVIFKALSSEFGAELLNGADASLDTGLVQVSPSVTVAPGRLLTLSITIAPQPPGVVTTINETITIQE